MRTTRERMGLPQNVLAMTMNSMYGFPWHQTTVGKVESGERPIRLAEAVAVAQSLGVPLDDLVAEAERAHRAALQSRASTSLYELDRIGEHISNRMQQILEGLDADGEHPDNDLTASGAPATGTTPARSTPGTSPGRSTRSAGWMT